MMQGLPDAWGCCSRGWRLVDPSEGGTNDEVDMYLGRCEHSSDCDLRGRCDPGDVHGGQCGLKRCVKGLDMP